MNNNFFHGQSYSYNKKRNGENEIKNYILVGYFKCRNIKLHNNKYTNKTAPLPT